MSRSERLLDLLQLLRRHRRPVGGAALAQELGISLRTLYRDIATLQAQGAGIDGAPGLGYVLREGFTLPPLMFSVEEVEALVLGSRWVMERGDARLGLAARDALAKIAAVLPPPLRRELDDSALLAGPGAPLAGSELLGALRDAIRQERRLDLDYRDAEGRASVRTVWPFALGYFDQVQVLVAWCELRGAIRHFRTDRIAALSARAERYPRRRQALLRAWREQEGVGEP
ncbi:helix-turn-helix transcriptional regulator [Azohydromonas caseinilytica]|uniref:YafY family transcriptional regulator n=1 Tax=Azohydromonas caseinilytica TaxID=2728836 RepID=A0A848FEY7_9BURK|nr:YafY family protein [Azohydromonas caseinilytica]NML16899.1 YafY family transcriptional regulator [Azohydromonas caseinilytica]